MEAYSIFASWIARGVQHGVGRGRIIGILNDLVGECPMLRRKYAFGQAALVAEEIMQDRPAVDGIRESLAHANVFQDRIAQVEGQVSENSSRLLFNFEFGVALQCSHGVSAQSSAWRDISTAFPKFKRARGLIRHHGEAHALDTRLFAPVGIVAFENHLAVRIIAYEAERPGPDGVSAEFAVTAVGHNTECAFRDVVE